MPRPFEVQPAVNGLLQVRFQLAYVVWGQFIELDTLPATHRISLARALISRLGGPNVKAVVVDHQVFGSGLSNQRVEASISMPQELTQCFADMFHPSGAAVVQERQHPTRIFQPMRQVKAQGAVLTRQQIR